MRSKTNTQKIIELTDKWYRYVNLDHHKTKDCIWTISISYEYGEAPKYVAYHNGYILDNWQSPSCDELEDAEQWLIDKLEREIEKAIIHLREVVDTPADESWYDQDKAIDILKELVR